jgi:hypothetical protein
LNLCFRAAHKRTFPLEFIDTMESVHLAEGCFACPKTASVANSYFKWGSGREIVTIRLFS